MYAVYKQTGPDDSTFQRIAVARETVAHRMAAKERIVACKLGLLLFVSPDDLGGIHHAGPQELAALRIVSAA